MIKILHASPLHSIQDQGRFGSAAQGIAHAGPMDALSAAWANRVVGNLTSKPVFEIGGGGFRAVIKADTNIGVAGAVGDIRINDLPVFGWGRFPVRKGSTIEISQINSGTFTYISIYGGLKIKPILGSVSTCFRDRLGGVTGRGDPLKAGDIISFDESRLQNIEFVPRQFVPSFEEALICDVMIYKDSFPEEHRSTFLSQSYVVSSEVSRMGYRLKGEKKISGEQSRYSTPMPLGAIQVPTIGQPIILMRDHQVFGGYPLLGCVTRKSLSLLAQRRPGQPIFFKQVSREEALKDLEQLRRFFGCFY